MSVFPVIDIRRNNDGSWNVVNKSENITVPSSSPYIYQLEEIPDNGSIVSKPTISGLSISEVYPPGVGEFYVNYGNGVVVFNLNEAGQSFTINYYGKGTLVSAYHINWLYDNKVNINGSPSNGQLAYFTDSNTIEGESEIDGGTF